MRISGCTYASVECLRVTVEENGCVGCGEAQGVDYIGDTPEQMLADALAMGEAIEGGLTRADLEREMSAGGARNAIDCALWDLEAKLRGASIWELTGTSPKPLVTCFTIGLEATPEEMAAQAADARSHSILKVKLGADRPCERIEAVRAAHPGARLLVDVNGGWDMAQLAECAPRLAAMGVEMIEQPLPRGGDDPLEAYSSPVPLCADESCLTLSDLDTAAGRYAMINIKLDKTGGLTHALALAEAAKRRGLGLMVGNMTGTSIAIAPSYVVGLQCDYIDLDGPLLLVSDVENGLEYHDGVMTPPSRSLWG